MRTFAIAACLVFLLVWDLAANHAAYTKEVIGWQSYAAELLWRLIP